MKFFLIVCLFFNVCCKEKEVNKTKFDNLSINLLVSETEDSIYYYKDFDFKKQIGVSKIDSLIDEYPFVRMVKFVNKTKLFFYLNKNVKYEWEIFNSTTNKFTYSLISKNYLKDIKDTVYRYVIFSGNYVVDFSCTEKDINQSEIKGINYIQLFDFKSNSILKTITYIKTFGRLKLSLFDILNFKETNFANLFDEKATSSVYIHNKRYVKNNSVYENLKSHKLQIVESTKEENSNYIDFNSIFYYFSFSYKPKG